MKKMICLMLIAFAISACKPSIEGKVTNVDSYGSVHTSFTIEEMLDKGFNYSDIIYAEFNDTAKYEMVITTAYSEVGIGSPSYCHYSKQGEASFGYCQGDFHKTFGGNVNDKVKIKVKKRKGYAKEYELLQSVYYSDRSLYPSDEVFANFREITTGNMKPNTVYRSGNPLNFHANPSRCWYVDSLARVHKIHSEVDIADTREDVKKYAKEEGFVSTYCYALFLNGRTVTLGMGSDTFCESAYKGFAEGMRHIINTNPPYLIHCNEGKDRCGFFCMLLESITGATIKELEDDYMVTYTNLYGMAKDTERYNLNLKITGDRLIWLIGYPDSINDRNYNWDKINLQMINPKEDAERFLTQKCGMTIEEVIQLENKLIQ